MIIELKSDLFLNVGNQQDLLYLLCLFFDNSRYSCFCELTEIRDTDIFNDLPQITKSVIEDSYNRINNESLAYDYVVSEDTNGNEFNLEEAKRFFNQPLIVILENSLNDGFFVNSLLKEFQSESFDINHHKSHGWLKYGNAGGCGNIINFINAEKANYTGLPKASHNYLKCFVLIDSDKKYNEDINPERIRLIENLKANKVPFHIFEKREIENYLPDDTLQTIDGNTDYIRTYTSLTPLQKDYFDIEKGFKNKNFTGLDEPIRSLYENVSKADYKILKKGINYRDFKSEIPKLFSNVTKEQFEEITKHQTNPKELENILDQITELL